MRVSPTREVDVGSSPIDPAQAVRALDRATDREQIFALLLRAACSRVSFAAILSVHKDGIRGRRAIGGEGFEASAIRGLKVQRNAVEAFEQAVATRAFYIGPIATGVAEVDEQLRRLGGVAPQVGVVLPVVLKERTVALIVGHNGERPVGLGDVTDLIDLIPASGRVLERVLATGAGAAAERPSLVPVQSRLATPAPVEQTDIDEVDAMRRVLAVCREYESWAELADAIRALLRFGLERGEPDEDEQLELLLELGRVEAERLGRPELAVEALRSALAINAADARVGEALEPLLVKQERWEEVVELLERRAALAEDPQERVFILLNLAAVSRDRLFDDLRALEAYERVRGWAPDHLQATEKLEALYRAHGRWEPLAELLVDVASRTDDASARVQALESAARIHEEQLQDPRGAFLLWLTVLRREPRRTGGVEALESLGAAAADWHELMPELEALATELEPADGEVAARLWRLVARWTREHLGLQDGYSDALERSVRHAPNDPELLDELLTLRRAEGPWVDLASVLARRATLELDPVRRAEFSAELGKVRETRLAQPAEAVAAYQEALAADPDCREALDGLRRIHREGEAWDELASVLQRLLELVKSEAATAEELALHLELGTVLNDHLGRSEEAARAFEAALALDPASSRALRGISKVHHATGRTDEYLTAVEAELDAAQSPAEARRYAELATAWEQREGQLDHAVACWRKLLVADGHDQAAHAGLIRCLRRAGRWAELADAHRAYYQVAFGVPQRAEILLELATDLEAGLGDADGAIAACEEVLALKVEPERALDLLARCWARKGRFDKALATLERLLERAHDPLAQAELCQRIARVHLGRGDEAKAVANFAFALERDPANAGAHEGAARIHQQKGDWAKAADHLRQAGLALAGRAEAIGTLVEAEALYRDRVGDLSAASTCVQRIVELDPDDAGAKQRLIELLTATRSWEALWPHLEQLAEGIDRHPDLPSEERRQICLRAARCALEVGRFEQASKLMDRAVAIAPSDVSVLLERADALRRSEAWEPAIKAYQAILVQQTGALDGAQRATAFRKLALIHKRLGNLPQTLAYHRKVLEFDEHDQETLKDLTQLHLQRGEVDAAIATLRALAESVVQEQRAPLFERIGDLQHEKLKNPARAESAYREALALDAGNRRILQKLLELQSESGQWTGAIETIARFLELESDPRRRGKYLLAMAAIRRFKMSDETAAADDYQRALEAFLDGPGTLDEAGRGSALEAFQNLDELAAARGDWQQRDRAHRLLIKRLPAHDPHLLRLWHVLGEIQTRLEDYQSAVYAFETAHALDPGKSPDRVRILAELYARVSRRAPTLATGHAARLVDAEPDNPEVYRAMGRACLEAGRIDEAWCVSRALVLRKQATRDEEEFYRRHQQHERRKAKGVLDDEAWGLLRDDEEDRVVSAIFAIIWEGPVALRAGPAKSFQLQPKERINVEDGTRAIGKIFQNAARVLNAPLPHVYAQPDRPGRLLLASCTEHGTLVPTVIVARDLMAGYRDTEIAFSVASALAFLRPAWYLRFALPTVAELEAALIAAVRLVRADVTVPPELVPVTEAFSAEIQKRLTHQAIEALHGLVARLGERPSLRRWRDGVDTAARRAGLLVCGELEAAMRMVSSEPVLPDGPSARDKVRDLVVFSVSPGYFSARRHLGVSIA